MTEKERDRARQRKRMKDFPWLSSFFHAKDRCENKRNGSYKYYGGKGIRFFLTKDEILLLWTRDKAWDMVSPSLDRKDSDGNYEFENCRFIEISANRLWGNLNSCNSRRSKTICKHGHDITGADVYINKHGNRSCKKCVLARNKICSERRKNEGAHFAH